MKKLIGYFLKKGADDFSKSSGAFLKKMPSFLETGFEGVFRWMMILFRAFQTCTEKNNRFAHIAVPIFPVSIQKHSERARQCEKIMAKMSVYQASL